MTYNPDDEHDITEKVGELLVNNEVKSMNKVNAQDVTFLSLSLGSFSAATTFLVSHDFPVAGGLFFMGIVLVYIYHKIGS